jgi:hypothetical protein
MLIHEKMLVCDVVAIYVWLFEFFYAVKENRVYYCADCLLFLFTFLIQGGFTSLFNFFKIGKFFNVFKDIEWQY